MLGSMFKNLSQGEELVNTAQVGLETRLVGTCSSVVDLAESIKQDHCKDLSCNTH